MSSFICKVKNIPWGGTLPWDSRWETIQRQTESWGTGSDTHPKIESGLGIRSMVFWANCLLFVSDSLMKKSKSLLLLFCHEWRERIAHSHSFVMSDWAKSNGSDSLLGIKRGKNVKKNDKNRWKIRFFQANRLFFKSDLLESRANHSLVKSNESNLLTVALL